MMIQVEDKQLEERPKEALTWFIVRSATRQEMKAEAALREARHDDGPLVHQVYLPRMKRLGWARRGERRPIERPLFAGYLFVLLDDLSRLDLIAEIDGVHGFMKFDGRPVRVPVCDVLDLQIRETAGEFDTCEEPARYRPAAKAKKARAGKRTRKWSALVTCLDAAGRERCLTQAYRRAPGQARPLAEVVAQEVGLRAGVIRA